MTDAMSPRPKASYAVATVCLLSAALTGTLLTEPSGFDGVTLGGPTPCPQRTVTRTETGHEEPPYVFGSALREGGSARPRSGEQRYRAAVPEPAYRADTSSLRCSRSQDRTSSESSWPWTSTACWTAARTTSSSSPLIVSVQPASLGKSRQSAIFLPTGCLLRVKDLITVQVAPPRWSYQGLVPHERAICPPMGASPPVSLDAPWFVAGHHGTSRREPRRSTVPARR